MITANTTTLFGVPIFSFHFNENVTQEEVDVIKSYPTQTTSSNISTKDVYILNNPKLNKIKNFCDLCVKVSFENYIKPKSDVEIYITQSWANFTKQNEMHYKHTHPNSFLSGVFYVQTEDTDKIIFENPLASKNILRCDSREWNLWNSETWWINAIQNNFIVFPSWLPHAVPKKEGGKERISIAINTFLRGQLGCDENKTGLIL